MGAWGAEISANDDFQDVKYIFFDFFYHDKISIEEIEDKIIEIYKDNIYGEDSGEWHDVYFAVAHCEWKCGVLSGRILNAVQDIISGGKNLSYWQELGADKKTLTARKSALERFLTKIKSENLKPFKRRYKKPFVFTLKTGDVFACYSKANSCYGCGVILEVTESRLKAWEEEYHFRALIAVADFTPEKLPTVEEVLSAEALDVFRNGGAEYTLPKRGVIVIGNVAEQIDKDYSEYFGSHKIDGRTYTLCSLRPCFDDLISKDKSKLVRDKFSIPGKPMRFFFDKKNLPTTSEVLHLDE